jgi:hypothetical protein
MPSLASRLNVPGKATVFRDHRTDKIKAGPIALNVIYERAWQSFDCSRWGPDTSGRRATSFRATESAIGPPAGRHPVPRQEYDVLFPARDVHSTERAAHIGVLLDREMAKVG